MNPWKRFPKFGNCSSRRMNGHMQLGLVSLTSYITGKNQFYLAGKREKTVPSRSQNNSHSPKGSLRAGWHKVRETGSSIANDLINSEDPKHTLFCRETAFVAVYALFQE